MALLHLCLEVERSMGRQREIKNGPRLIDLDVLVVGGARMDADGLTLPHPGIASRRSVLEPWADVAPELVVPGLEAPLEALRSEAKRLTEQQVRNFLELY